MKLAVILSIISAFAFVDICSGGGSPFYGFRLFNQRAVVPARDDEIVQYEITYPTNLAELYAGNYNFLNHHDFGAESTMKRHENNRRQRYLESKPGQAIDAMLTYQYYKNFRYEEPFSSTRTVHEIIVPFVNSSTFEHKVSLRKETGVINEIEANFFKSKPLMFKIVDGGIGSEEVTIVIESDHNSINEGHTKVIFTLN